MSTNSQTPSAPFTPATTGFVDRRVSKEATSFERRQFANSYEGLSDDARELAEAVDNYKLLNRRRYVTYEEILSVVKSLGYSKKCGASE